MSLESQIVPASVFSFAAAWFLVKIALVVLAGLYFIFSLVVVRQVNLMTDTLITEVSPFLRFLAIIHAGFALGIIILLIGFLF